MASPEALTDKLQDRDFTIAVLVAIIILLLLFWHRRLTLIENKGGDLPSIVIPTYQYATDGLVPPPPGMDWGQTTDLMCDCGGDTEFYGGPILSPPSYVYVPLPPVPGYIVPPLEALPAPAQIPAATMPPPAVHIDVPAIEPPTYSFWFAQATTTHGKQQDVIQTSDGKTLRLKDDQDYSFATVKPSSYVINRDGSITYGTRRYTLDASKNDFGPKVHGRIYLHAGKRYRQSVLNDRYPGHEDAEWH